MKDPAPMLATLGTSGWGLVVMAAAIGIPTAVYLYRRFRLAPKPLSPESSHEAKKLLTPESRFVEANGARLHYIQVGKGPDIVLVHGIGASLFIWRFIFPLLQTHYRVTAFDLPGFGKSSKDPKHDYGLDSQAESVAQATSRIGIKQAYLVGSSMGGAITLWMGKLYPERFTRIAALAPATDPRLVPAGIRRWPTSAALALPFLKRSLNARSMKYLISRIVTNQALITDEVVQAYLEPFSDRGDSLRAFWSALALLSDRRLPSELKGLKSKVLVIYGQHDHLVPKRSIKLLTDLLPDAHLVTHPTAGHHMMEDDPEWTFEQLADFFA